MEPPIPQSSHDTPSEFGGRAAGDTSEAPTAFTRIEQIPRDVGLLLLLSGMITGMLPPPPGPFDLSLMLSGGVVLWPRGFRTLEGWTQRKFPQAHLAGVGFLERFLVDLERRYPDSND